MVPAQPGSADTFGGDVFVDQADGVRVENKL
jgi:hypothetical protein